MTNNQDDVIEIDPLHLLGVLWRRGRLILLVSLLSGILALAGTQHLLTPLYESSVMMYISSTLSSEGPRSGISQGDLLAAQSLTDTYAVILKTHATLDEVLAASESACTYEELLDRISTEAVRDTEVLKVTVALPDPEEAARIANAILQILPEKAAAIVEGSSARAVETAAVPTHPASPGKLANTAAGMLLGLTATCVVLVARELMTGKGAFPHE